MLKTPSLNHGFYSAQNQSPSWLPGATKSHLIRTKGTPITQEIARDLEAQCLEPEEKTKIYFFY